jgi:hypothetical protein
MKSEMYLEWIESWEPNWNISNYMNKNGKSNATGVAEYS